MSSSGSLAGITFGGISSGIDTENIISRLAQLEQVPIQRMQQNQQRLQSKQGLYSSLKSQVSALNSAASQLNNSLAFQAVTASSSDTAVATLETNGANSSGSYSLTVTKLAQAHKINSAAQSNSSTPMGFTGTIVVNGKSIDIGSGDTLTAISQKINSVDSGVTASIIDGGTGQNFLTLTANKSGAASSIQLSDQSGSVLSNLGLVTGSTSIREAITNGATSVSFSSNSSTLASMMGGTGLGSKTVQINGTNVTLADTDSLADIASKINSAVSGVTATVRSTTDSKTNTTTYKLDIAGASATPTFTDSGNFLSSIGIVQKSYGNQLVQAQDAAYTLDGVNLTSSTNTITSTIPGATLTLLKGTVATPGTATLNLTKDISGIKSKITGLQSAYNNFIDYIKENSDFDKDTYQTGQLFGDPYANQIKNTVQSNLFKNFTGGTGTNTNLTALGFAFDKEGKLTLDDAKLTSALNNNLTQVANLFKPTGVSTNVNLTYVSSTTKTRESGSGQFAINVTQAATQMSIAANTAQTSNLASAETLTFTSGIFGSTPYSLSLTAGMSQAQVASTINNDSKLKDLVSASIVGGKLQISSRSYGATSSFTVTSNLAAAANNSGVGTAGQATVTAGLDVAGTINGEVATGQGQYLTGNTGNSTTEGLQIQYTGTTTGNIGSMQFNKGVAGTVNDMVDSFNNSTNGLFKTVNDQLQTQIDDISTNIKDLNTRLTKKTTDLRKTFAAMEQQISTYQQQGQRLSAINNAR